MCGGGGGGGGGGAPRPNPAVAVANAIPSRSSQDPATLRGGTGTPAERRMAQRGRGRRPMSVALDVSVANVGGSGATGLNIPNSK